MDEVLRNRYRGKLEHRETDLVESLPPPCHIDQLALTAATPSPPVTEGTSASVEETPLTTCPISTVAPTVRAYSSSAEVVKDSKDGIISDVRRVQAKRKAVLAMGEAFTGALNIGKRVQSSY